MTRAFAALLSAGLLMLALTVFAQSLAPIPALTSPVVDTTGTLNAGEIAQLEQQALALQQRKGSQLQILIVPTTQPEAIEQYAQRVFDEWKLGRSKVDDGVLLLVAKDDREVRIQAGYGLEGAIPDIAAGRVIQEYLVPRFRSGDFAGGIGDASAQLVRLIEGETLPAPMVPLTGNNGGGLSDGFGAMFFAFIVAIFSRNLFGRLPLPLRMLLGAATSGTAALLYSAPWWLVLAAALGGAVIGSVASMGRYVKHGGWGSLGASGPSGRSSWPSSSGSSWPSSSSSNSRSSSGSRSSSSGWSGGGGRSGGGGASGRW